MKSGMVQELIESKIYLVRGKKVMLDSDLARLYGVSTKKLNEAVKRNSDRFPGDFLYLLTNKEVAILKSQFATSKLQEPVNKEVTNLKSQFATSSLQAFESKQLAVTASLQTWGGRRKPVCAFTEQGIAMLSSILNSKRAIQVNIQIMRTFTRLRELLSSNELLRQKIEEMEKKYDQQFQVVFEAIKKLIEPDPPKPKRQIGFLSKKISDFAKEESL